MKDIKQFLLELWIIHQITIQDYYITEEMTTLQLVFKSNISENNQNEWITKTTKLCW